MQQKAIRNQEGRYSVSRCGVVISHERVVKGRKFKERILTPNLDKYGYLRVTLQKGSRKLGNEYRTVHRLVADAFIDNPDSLPCVNHKDGNKLNNNVSNLEWCTWKENTQHGWRMGLCKAYDRKLPYNSEAIRNRNRKARKYHFNSDDVVRIKQLRNEGLSQQKIGDIMGIPQGTISQILKGALLPQVCGI